MSADRILEVRDLSVAYGKVEALTNANLDVGTGQIVTVIGPNGAGKTTMLAAIMGALPANGSARGTVRFGASNRDPPCRRDDGCARHDAWCRRSASSSAR